MKTGDMVEYGGTAFSMICEYDDEWIYINTGNNGAQLVSKSELTLISPKPEKTMQTAQDNEFPVERLMLELFELITGMGSETTLASIDIESYKGKYDLTVHIDSDSIQGRIYRDYAEFTSDEFSSLKAILERVREISALDTLNPQLPF